MKSRGIFRAITVAIVSIFLGNFFALPSSFAQTLNLPAPGQRVLLSSSFKPVTLRGVRIDPSNPFNFNFLVDEGDLVLTQEEFKEESQKVIKYFLTSLTVPDEDLWVNLSPYEKNRIIPNEFGKTEMGRDLLAQDYLLKQITASLIYPEGDLGKQFWQKIYQMAQEKYGSTDVPVNTFNKVWIVPDSATVYEKKGTAFVVNYHLKVMLEQDYLSLDKNMPTRGHVPTGTIKNVSPSRLPSDQALNVKALQGTNQTTNEVNQLGSQIVREIVLPQLEKEVNEGKNFAPLRQVFYSLILSTWYKTKLKNALLNKIFTDKNKIEGVQANDPQIKEKIYQQYLKAFKKGVFNYIKDDLNPVSKQFIPRKYFSGGVTGQIPKRVLKFVDTAQIAETMHLKSVEGVMLGVDSAMNAAPKEIESSFPIVKGNLALQALMIQFPKFGSFVNDFLGNKNPLIRGIGEEVNLMVTTDVFLSEFDRLFNERIKRNGARSDRNDYLLSLTNGNSMSDFLQSIFYLSNQDSLDHMIKQNSKTFNMDRIRKDIRSFYVFMHFLKHISEIKYSEESLKIMILSFISIGETAISRFLDLTSSEETDELLLAELIIFLSNDSQKANLSSIQNRLIFVDSLLHLPSWSAQIDQLSIDGNQEYFKRARSFILLKKAVNELTLIKDRFMDEGDYGNSLHDINNTMTIILGFYSFLEDDLSEAFNLEFKEFQDFYSFNLKLWSLSRTYNSTRDRLSSNDQLPDGSLGKLSVQERGDLVENLTEMGQSLLDRLTRDDQLPTADQNKLDLNERNALEKSLTQIRGGSAVKFDYEEFFGRLSFILVHMYGLLNRELNSVTQTGRPRSEDAITLQEALRNAMGLAFETVTKQLNYKKAKKVKVNLEDFLNQQVKIFDNRWTDFRIIREDQFTRGVVVFIDPVRMGEVFVNFIKNAAEAAGFKGTITITTKVEGDQLSISFKDNGPGIPQNVVTHVFDQGFSTKPDNGDGNGGAGIGLSVVQKIVEIAHEGVLSVQTQADPTQGPTFTEFKMVLPKTVTDKAMESENKLRSTGGIDLTSKRYNLNIKSDGELLKMDFDENGLFNLKFNGLEFHINRIEPILNPREFILEPSP